MDIVRRDATGNEYGMTREMDPWRMMRDMMRWDPFRDLGFVETRPRAGYTPLFDVKETRDSYVFEADLPGMREEDVAVSITGNRLSVSGNRSYESRDEGENYYTCERGYGHFARAFTLPEGVNTEGIKANLENGVLCISVPKRPEVQSRTIALGRGGTTTTGRGTNKVQ